MIKRLMTTMGQKAWLSFFIVLLTATFIQVYQLDELASDPTVKGPIIDGRIYHQQAIRLAEEDKSLKRPHWQSPLFPWMLSMVYRVSESRPINGIYFQAFLAILIALVTVAIARRILSPVYAILAGISTCFYGPLLFYCGQLIPAPLATVTALVSLYGTITTKRDGPIYQHGLLGIMTGMAITARGNIAPFVLWLLYRPYTALPKRKASTRSTALFVGVIIGLAPVSISNYVRSGIFTFSTTNLGINLFIGNNPSIEKTTAVRPGHEWDNLLSEPARHGALTPWEQTRYFEKKSIQWILDDPFHWAVDLLIKTSDLFNGKEISRNLDSYGKLGHTVLSSALMRDGWIKLPFGLVFPLAIIGFISISGLNTIQKEAAINTIFFVVLNAIGIILFFPTGRYRLALAIALVPIAWLGIQTVVHRIKKPTPFNHLSIIVGLLTMAWANWSITFTGPDMSKQKNLQLSWAYISSNQLQKASLVLEEEVSQRPDRSDSWRTLAEVRDRLGDRKGAISALRRAIQITPSFAHALQHLGVLLSTDHRFDESIQVLERSVESNPGHPLAWANLARAYIGISDFSNALYTAQRAVHINPEYGPGFLYLGIAMRRSGDPEGAEPNLRRSIRMLPNQPRPRNQLARCLLELGHREEAIELLRYTAIRWPRYQPARVLLRKLIRSYP